MKCFRPRKRWRIHISLNTILICHMYGQNALLLLSTIAFFKVVRAAAGLFIKDSL